eukprot:Rmarinus@m.3238
MLGEVLLTGLESALQATAHVFIICAGGALCQKHLSLESRKGLSGLVMRLFLPCLLISRVSPTATAENLVSWWPVIVFCLTYSAVGTLIGAAIGILLRRFLWPELTWAHLRFIMTGCAFSNNTSIPLALLTSLVQTSDFYASEFDDEEEALEQGTAYIMLYTLCISVVRWTVGYWLLDIDKSELYHFLQDSPAPEDVKETIESTLQDSPSEVAYRPSDRSSIPFISAGTIGDMITSSSREASASGTSPGCREHEMVPIPPLVCARTPTDHGASDGSVAWHPLDISRLTTSRDGGENPTNDHDVLPCSQPAKSEHVHNDHHTKDLSENEGCEPEIDKASPSLSWKARLGKVMSPPLWASVIALIIGLTPLRHYFFGDDAIFKPVVTSALSTVGAATVPCILIVLGADLWAELQMYRAERRKQKSANDNSRVADVTPPVAPSVAHAANPSGAKESELQPPPMFSMWQLFVAVVVGRLLVCPAVMIPLTVAFFPVIPDEPVMRFILLIETAGPTAINVSVMAKLFGVFERDIARLFIMVYPCAVLTLTMWMAVCVNLV